MEEILVLLKKRLASAFEISIDEENLQILLKIKERDKIIGIIAEGIDILNMLRMLGGLKEEIPIEIKINNDSGIIILKFKNKNDMNKVGDVLDKIYDRIIYITDELVKGNYEIMKDIGDFHGE